MTEKMQENVFEAQTKEHDTGYKTILESIIKETEMIMTKMDTYKIVRREETRVAVEIQMSDNLIGVVIVEVPNSKSGGMPRLNLVTNVRYVEEGKSPTVLGNSVHVFGPYNHYANWQAVYETSVSLHNLYTDVENELKGKFLSHIKEKQLEAGKLEMVKYVMHIVNIAYTNTPLIPHLQINLPD